MPLGKSIRVASAQKGFSNNDLAKEMGIAPTYLSQMKKSNSVSRKLMGKLLVIFNLKESEFVALGED